MAVAAYYSMLGDVENAMGLIEKAAAENSYQVRYVYADPIWDSLRNEPRYKELVKQLGLSQNTEAQEPTRKPDI